MAKHIFLVGESVVLHLLEGPELRTHHTERIEKRKNAQRPAGFEPTTSLLRGVRSTAVLQPLPRCMIFFKQLTCFSTLKFSIPQELSEPTDHLHREVRFAPRLQSDRPSERI